MLEFWNSLSTAAQVFYCVAIPATLVLIIQTVLMFIGFGDDADTSLDETSIVSPGDFGDSDGIFGEELPTEAHDSFGFEGLRIFTVRGIVAFFVMFGWVGIVMEAANVALYITLPVAAVCGFAMMLLLAFILRSVMKLRNDGNLDNRNAIGVSGKVHLVIPPNRSGDGKIHILLPGSYVEREAVTDSSEPIPTGAEIVVTAISGQTTLVVSKK